RGINERAFADRGEFQVQGVAEFLAGARTEGEFGGVFHAGEGSEEQGVIEGEGFELCIAEQKRKPGFFQAVVEGGVAAGGFDEKSAAGFEVGAEGFEVVVGWGGGESSGEVREGEFLAG